MFVLPISCYIATRTVIFQLDQSLRNHTWFATYGAASDNTRNLPGNGSPSAKNELVYEGPGWLGNQWRTIECWQRADGFSISADSCGEFLVSDDGFTILQTASLGEEDTHLLTEAALGPPLILALALQGIWCLHASAAAYNGRVAAILGESGFGKSTLAAYLAAHSADWEYVSDDILPVDLSDSRPQVLPRFPQLKVAPDRQPSFSLPERMPLSAIYVLTPSEPSSVDVQISTSGGRDALLTLVHHTVGSRLFNGELLARHLNHCAIMAPQIPVRTLSYPRRYDVLPTVRDALASDLESIRSG